jgi:hypothetical protein
MEHGVYISWEALGVIALVGGGILGWLLGLTSKLSSHSNEISHLREQVRNWDSLEICLTRLEEKLEAIADFLNKFFGRDK